MKTIGWPEQFNEKRVGLDTVQSEFESREPQFLILHENSIDFSKNAFILRSSDANRANFWSKFITIYLS